MTDSHPTHKLGKKAKVLLSSVFGPYAVDDEYGSRAINPMELYQNQVTRVQGIFSLRMFHQSFGLALIQENLEGPCTILDFPTLDQFINEVSENDYDVVGITAIPPNILKAKKMCEVVREHLPQAKIIIGGHIANVPDIEKRLDADHVVKGDGVSWMRRYFGQDPEEPVKHPAVSSAFGSRIVGHSLSKNPKNTAAILVPSVGCPVGCNFCATSALFGGKGKHINFYETGKELFDVMCGIEKKLKVKSFFILDENFLLQRKRALELLDLMEAHGKHWALSVFSSARVLRSYEMEQLVRLGVSWVWMGMEDKASQYRKLKGVDTHALVDELKENGIRVLGSTILGLEHHTPENIGQAIDHAVAHNTDFHQFMLYTPVPGTPLHAEHQAKGTLYPESEFSLSDAHGQYRFNYRHDHFKNGEEEQVIIDAFTRDFEVNGPSLSRIVRTYLRGWQKYKNHSSRHVRRRMNWEIDPIRKDWAGAVWAMRKHYRHDPAMFEHMDRLLKDLYSEFGMQTKILAPIIGRIVSLAMKREQKRLDRGWAYEPQCLRRQNSAAKAQAQKSGAKFKRDLPLGAGSFKPVSGMG
ncbi:MAG: cobalamin-dependent protein [Proteobacteria bacterium]|nr:cobalamin-dependent protein [Pseudomonadota bacterium]